MTHARPEHVRKMWDHCWKDAPAARRRRQTASARLSSVIVQLTNNRDLLSAEQRQRILDALAV